MRDYNDYSMKQSEFFKAFSNGGDSLNGKIEPLMLKVKDYPPEAAFADNMPRHWQVSPYTHLPTPVSLTRGRVELNIPISLPDR